MFCTLGFNPPPPLAAGAGAAPAAGAGAAPPAAGSGAPPPAGAASAFAFMVVSVLIWFGCPSGPFSTVVVVLSGTAGVPVFEPSGCACCAAAASLTPPSLVKLYLPIAFCNETLFFSPGTAAVVLMLGSVIPFGVSTTVS